MSAKIIYGVFGAQAASEARGRQIARLREIETAPGRGGLGKKGHVFTAEQDRIRAASAVGRIVRAAKEHGVSVNDIKEALEGAGRTARLDRYMIPVARVDGGTAGSAAKLQSKVSGYLDVVTAVAKLTGNDADLLKVEVLASTSLWSRRSSDPQTEDPRAHYLALQLSEMARSVSRGQSLGQAFSRASKIPGQWDLEAQCLRAASSPCLPEQSYLEGMQHWTEAPPLPSVMLSRQLHAVFPMRFDIDQTARQERYSPDELSAEGTGEGTVEIEGRLELWRETRLALGPVSSLQDVGALFETRAYVRILADTGDEAVGALHPSCTLKPIDDLRTDLPRAVFQTSGPDGWRRIATVGRIDASEALVSSANAHPNLWAPGTLDGGPDCEHWYLCWTAVNEKTVTEFLDRPVLVGRQESANMSGRRNSRPVWYAAGTSAHDVEAMLASGALEDELERQTATFRSELSRHEMRWRECALDLHEKRMSEWARCDAAGDPSGDH